MKFAIISSAHFGTGRAVLLRVVSMLIKMIHGLERSGTGAGAGTGTEERDPYGVTLL